ncbi:MAG: arginine deiminase [Clostridia bacterium]|nr:arginine deiminase [Clostridia bacterium]
MQSPICVRSEVGKLKKVLLHRPGKELENLMPDFLARQLFDDIPYLVTAQQEHDAFAETLKSCGVEVLYLNQLLKEALEAGNAREELVWEYLHEANMQAEHTERAVSAYLASLPLEQLITTMACGVRKSDLPKSDKIHLIDYIDENYPFCVDPMPNLYFTRDPFSCIDQGVMISTMANVVRARETLFYKYIFKYHPVYKWVKKCHERTDIHSIEGGDCLVLSGDTLCIGISQRTSPQAIELMANRLIGDRSDIKQVIAVDIPKSRAFMHLDTVMTMVDRDKFVVHPNILKALRCFTLTKVDNRVKIKEEQRGITEVFAEALHCEKVQFIECGGASMIDAAREQWNDGANTLCVAPGEVITYMRNYVTNRILRDNGIKVHEVPSAELSRGRGGPRCMSMPFLRESLN